MNSIAIENAIALLVRRMRRDVPNGTLAQILAPQNRPGLGNIPATSTGSPSARAMLFPFVSEA